MTTPADIESWIQSNMSVQSVTVNGDGRHFEAVVVSEAFVGKNTMARHRLRTPTKLSKTASIMRVMRSLAKP